RQGDKKPPPGPRKNPGGGVASAPRRERSPHIAVSEDEVDDPCQVEVLRGKAAGRRSRQAQVKEVVVQTDADRVLARHRGEGDDGGGHHGLEYCRVAAAAPERRAPLQLPAGELLEAGEHLLG